MPDLVSGSFSSKIRERGRRYFRSGSVDIVEYDARKHVVALVYGSTSYGTTLTAPKREGPSWTILATCTCPYIDSFGAPCKHIFATLLEAEQRGFLDAATGKIEVELDWDAIEEPYDDFDGDFGDERGPVYSPPAISKYRRPKSARKKSPKLPAWESTLKQLAEKASHDPGGILPGARAYYPLYVLTEHSTAPQNNLVVSLLHQDRLKSGKLGKPKPLRLESQTIPSLATDLDRQICLLLIGAACANNTSYGGMFYSGYYGIDSSKLTVPQTASKSLIPLMQKTNRLFVATKQQWSKIKAFERIELDEAGPWEVGFRFEPDGAKKPAHRLVCMLRRGDESISASELGQKFGGYAVRNGKLLEIDADGSESWLTQLNDGGVVARVPASGRAKAIKRLAGARHLPQIEWPDEWNIDTIADVAPTPCLALRIDEHELSNHRRDVDATLTFRYDDTVVQWPSHGRSVLDADASRHVMRMPDREAEYARQLMDAGARFEPYRESLSVDLRSVSKLVYDLLQKGWQVTGNRFLFHTPGDVNIETTSGIDWFDMTGGVQYGELTADLPELLRAWRKGEKFVRLSDGSLGMLPEEWLAKHGKYFDLGQETDGNIRFTQSQIGLLDALLEQMPEVTFDDTIAQARKRLAEFDGVRPQNPRKSFKGELRPYQSQGLGWLKFLNDFGWGGCLADDMGLGKTVQVLAQLLGEHTGRGKPDAPSLIVVPRSLIFNWMREAERFAPKLRVLDYSQPDRDVWRDKFNEFDIILTTYGTLRRDIEILSKIEFHYAILDEAQAIKNPNSQSFKSARLLRAGHRLAMTGTPVENHMGDVWSISQFTNPGLLGTQKAFRSTFGAPRGKANEANADQTNERLQFLQRMLRPFILRRTKQQVAPELPPRSEQVLECELPAKQRKYYDEIRDYYRASLLGRIDESGMAKSKMHILEALLRLRQAACHPGLIDERKKRLPTAKLDTLIPMLEEIAGENHKALIFSQFTSMLAIVRDQLDKKKLRYAYLDGKTRKRDALVDRFQSDDDCRLFLISLKAGGTGLNLTAADYVFILDPWWNPAVEAQAIDRTHRIGQDKHVIAYRLIAKETVESKILELQAHKRELAESIVTEANSLMSQLTREDLSLLLS